MKLAAGIHRKVVVSEDMEVGEMNRLASAQILPMEFDVCQERPKTRWHCGLSYYRNAKAHIGLRASFDCLGLEKIDKKIEAWYDAQHSMKALAVDLD